MDFNATMLRSSEKERASLRVAAAQADNALLLKALDDLEELVSFFDILKQAKNVMIPGMANSMMAMMLPDKTLPGVIECLEMGAAVLLDKPIILTVAPDMQISTNLKRCAAAIVDMNDWTDPEKKEQVMNAIQNTLANDARIPRERRAEAFKNKGKNR